MKNMRNGNEGSNGKKLETRFTRVMLAVMAMCIWFNSGFYSFAGGANYAENAGEWALSQIWWIALVVIAFILLGCMLKKAWVNAVIVLVCGGCILVFIARPQLLETIGNTLVNFVFCLG